MIKLSLLLGNDVLDTSSARIIGRIKNAYFMQDLKQIAYFLISLQNKDEDALVSLEEITSLNDAIVVQNGIKLISANDFDFTSYICDVLNMSVYTPIGILKGQVEEIEFYPSGKVGKFYTSTTTFSPSAILSVGDIILLKTSTKTAKIQKTQSVSIPRPQSESTVSILSANADNAFNAERQPIVDNLFTTSDESATDDKTTSVSTPISPIKQADVIPLDSAPLAVKISSKTPYFSQNAFNSILGESDYSVFDDTHTPTRVICDYSFLLDRTLEKDVLSLRGTIIASRGERITDEVVSRARREGKLVDLALNSVR